MDPLTLALFGTYSAVVIDNEGSNKTIGRFRTNRVQALLAYLAVEHNRGTPTDVSMHGHSPIHRRDALAELLWPGMPTSSALQNLRQTLYELKKIIPDRAEIPFLLTSRQTIQVNPDYPMTVDTNRFTQLLAHHPDHWQEAVDLYRGDFLADFQLPDAATFELWAAERRADYRRRVLDALTSLVDMQIERQAYAEAESLSQRQLAIDPLREKAHQQLMTALTLNGKRAEALQRFEICKNLLNKQLAVPVSQATEALAQTIRAGKMPAFGRTQTNLGGYELKEMIGSGNFGSVYRGIQTSVGREVAIKIIRDKYANDPDFIRQFEVEAQTIAKLEHPHIVPLHDFWREPGGAYLVMRWLRGGSLADQLEQNNGWTSERALPLVHQIGQALHAAHSRGIIHRDIKPANILLDEAGNGYLSDFGIASSSGNANQGEPTSLTSAEMLLSASSMSPEQVSGRPITKASDIYSFGILLYQLLTEKHPFRAESPTHLAQLHVTQPLPSLLALRPRLPPELDRVIKKATAKRPEDRYRSIPEMVQAFQQAETGRQRNHASRQTISSDIPASLADKAANIFGQLVKATEPPPFIASDSGRTAIDAGPFVAREKELTRLNNYLTDTLDRRGKLIFLSGEAGAGKTSLIKTFAQQAQATFPQLVTVQGLCNVYTGAGDPYVPFQSIMSMLLGDVTAQWLVGGISQVQALRLWELLPSTIEVLLEHSPELINVFAPRRIIEEQLATYAKTCPRQLPKQAALFAKLHEFQPPFQPDQSRLFEAYALLLEQLAADQPLLLVVDDLHWGDLSSISLLSFLGKRLAQSSVLLIGAFRPEDVAQGRSGAIHPLQNVVSEWQRQAGDITISLDGTESGQQFIEALLATIPNHLPESFRTQLTQLTSGHPLFTVEVLRDLEEQNILQRDDSGFLTQVSVAWEALPPKVEGVIARRIDRLNDSLKSLLAAASVEGEFFTAEVNALVVGQPAPTVVRQLGKELDRQHHLVRPQGVTHSGQQRRSIYQFRHNLFQKYVYERLDAAERAYYHEDVGRAMEKVYGDYVANRPGLPAAQLARHFEEAQQFLQASRYLLIAGQKAAELIAFDEAVAHFEHGLRLLTDSDLLSENTHLEFDLTHNLSQSYWYGGHFRAMMPHSLKAIQIARTLDDPAILAQAVLAYEEPRWRLNLDKKTSETFLREALEVLGTKDSGLRVQLLVNLARTLLGSNELIEQRNIVNEALGIARRINDPEAIYDALRSKVQLDRRPKIFESRISAVDEMIVVAETMGNQALLADAISVYIYDHIELGHTNLVDQAIVNHKQIAEKTKQPFQLHTTAVYRTMQAILYGDFEKAERLANKAADLSEQIGLTELDGILGMHMFTIRWMQGRLHEVAPILKFQLMHDPSSMTWQPGLALIYACLGEKSLCRELFEKLAADSFSTIPFDALWVTSIAYLSEVCVYLDNQEQAVTLYEKLLPYNGRTIVVSGATACYGAVARYLGMLAATVDSWNKAQVHFEEALALDAQMNARPWLAQTQYEFATMLLKQALPENRLRARNLLDESWAVAQELGMAYLIDNIKATTQSRHIVKS